VIVGEVIVLVFSSVTLWVPVTVELCDLVLVVELVVLVSLVVEPVGMIIGSRGDLVLDVKLLVVLVSSSVEL
jgi:hypothetical protein